MKYYSSSEIMNLISKTSLKYQDHGNYIKFKCINPSHDDSNPSMTMLKGNGYAKCWSCGVTYNFITLYYHLTGEKIVSRESDFSYSLMNKNKIRKNQVYSKQKEIQYRIEKGQLYSPFISPTVIQYLNSINVGRETIDYFDIKFIDRGKIGFSSKYETTFLQNRICIPIVENNQIVNMECRDFTGAQKLKVIYPKGSKADVLFNCDNLDKNKPLIVVEGIKSALRIWRYISKNVTATLGSAIGNGQKEKLKEFKNIILFPDNDTAGKSMIEQFENFYSLDYHISFMAKEGYDPADGSIKEVQEAIENRITNQRYLNTERFGIPNELKQIFLNSIKLFEEK